MVYVTRESFRNGPQGGSCQVCKAWGESNAGVCVCVCCVAHLRAPPLLRSRDSVILQLKAILTPNDGQHSITVMKIAHQL